MTNHLDINYFFFSWQGKKEIDYGAVISRPQASSYDISLSGSKSYTNRMIVLAGMTSSPVSISGILFAEDSYWGFKALQDMGFQLKFDYLNKQVNITPPQKNISETIKIYLGKAGTLARFFPAVILNWTNTFPHFSDISVELNSDNQLKKRPLKEYLFALANLYGNIQGESLPIKVSSSNLRGKTEISGKISGQFLSGLLLAISGANNEIEIIRKDNLVQPDYIKMTIHSINCFSKKITFNDDLTQFIYKPCTRSQLEKIYLHIEADASTACYYILLACLHNFNLKISNLGNETLQPDYNIVYLLKEMGFLIDTSRYETKINNKILDKNHSKYHIYFQNQDIKEFDASHFSDQAITLGILALFSNIPFKVKGIAHVRHHESDRIHCFVKNLNNLGIKSDELDDGFIVYPLKMNLTEIEGIWHTWEDHRFVMVGFILGSFCPKLKIENPHFVEKTQPHFFEVAQYLGFELNEIE